ncbi:hypothetical protein ACFWBF_11530 [Streptomyces sp. NPDC060028]|uniref:hypothetical protein n=1 Tax=Streptomyces sp. NPDC060028 TaxID=3347041 RepID=UPI003695690C
MVAWLVAHGKIQVPTRPPVATLLVSGSGGGTRTARIQDPLLLLADDTQGTERLSAWAGEADADALAGMGETPVATTVRRLAVPGETPLAVIGDARLSGRMRPGAGGLWIELSWPSRIRGAAAGTRGVVRHGLAYAGPGEKCACKRYDCRAVVPVDWRRDHGTQAGPVREWQPGGGVRCAELTRRRTGAVTATVSGP